MIPNSMIQRLNIWLRKLDFDGNFKSDWAENLSYSNFETDEQITKGDILIKKSNGYLGLANAKDHDHFDFIALESKDGSTSPTKIAVTNIGGYIEINQTFTSDKIGSIVYLSADNPGKLILDPMSETSNAYTIEVGYLIDTNHISLIPNINIIKQYIIKQYMNYDFKNDWDGNTNTWDINFQIDTNKPILLIVDGITLSEDQYTISGQTITFIGFNPANFTSIIGFDLTLESENLLQPPLYRNKNDWDGNTNTWTLDFPINVNYPIIMIADSRFLEYNVDYTINNNIITFQSNPVQFTTLISYPNTMERLLTPFEENITAISDNQELFTLQSLIYAPNTHDIDIYKNGIKINKDKITELNSKEFKLDQSVGIITGDIITVKKIGVINSDLYDVNLYEVLSPIEEIIEISSSGQTTINLSTMSYEPNKNQIEVFLNGIKLEYIKFTETNSTTIELDSSISTSIGDKIIVRRLGISPTSNYSKLGFQIYKTDGLTVKNNNGLINLNFTYEMGYNQLILLVNGIEKIITDDYTETSNYQITLTSNLLNTINDSDKIIVKKGYIF